MAWTDERIKEFGDKLDNISSQIDSLKESYVQLVVLVIAKLFGFLTHNMTRLYGDVIINTRREVLPALLLLYAKIS